MMAVELIRGEALAVLKAAGLDAVAAYERMTAAKQEGAEFFTTTLTISPHKNPQLINPLGQRLGEEYGITWLCGDFKKQNGYLHSLQLSAEYGLYRQDYCGCVFSRRD